MNKKSIVFWVSFLVSCCFAIAFFILKEEKLDLPIFIDPFDGFILIEENEVPGGKPDIKTTTKSSTKKTIKKVKMKTVAKTSYSKKLPIKTKVKTQNFKKETDNSIIQTKVVTETTTTIVEQYIKKSKIKKIISEIVTKVTTTVTTIEKTNGVIIQPIAANASTKEIIKKDSNIRILAARADEKILSAFEDLGFSVSIDSTVNYTGCFDARERKITMKNESSLSIYHELGHFVSFIAGNIDKTQTFSSIYQEEKVLYNSYNKSYVTQNASEYFAESIKDYILDKNTLRQNRPKTYNAIVEALNKITDDQIIRCKTVYSAIWTS